MIFVSTDTQDKKIINLRKRIYITYKEINTDEDLFIICRNLFEFPLYFGCNWDALKDIFLSEDWLCGDSIALIFAGWIEENVKSNLIDVAEDAMQILQECD